MSRKPGLASCLALAGQLLCVAAVATFVLLPGGAQRQAVAAADSAWLGLAVKAPRTVEPGEPIPLHLSVTNQNGVACALAPMADGTVGLDVRRDGERLHPTFGLVKYIDGYQTAMTGRSRTVPAGESVSFTLVSEPERDGQSLSAVSVNPAGDVVDARWSLDRPGSYSISATYAMPGGKGACAGTSGSATVTVTIAKQCPQTAFPLLALPWVFGAGAALCLGAAWSVRGRRRLVALRAAALAACVTLVGLGVPSAASAQIFIASPIDPKLQASYDGCLATYQTNDPAAILPFLLSGHWVVIIRRTDIEKGSKASPRAAHTAVFWNPEDDSLFSDGVQVEGCAALYHELVHALDFGFGIEDTGECAGIDKSEIRATRAENAYRANRNLDQREMYGTFLLPPGTDWTYAGIDRECAGIPPVAPRQARGCGAGIRAPGDRAAPSPATSACSTGDPHLTTFDKRRYDFQAVGEFVLAKAADIEVQARQAPLDDSRVVSVNSDIGLRVGPDRLSFAMHDGLRVRLNGADTILTSAERKLPGGGTAVFDQDGQYLVTWPDGTRAEIGAMSGWGLTIVLQPSDALRTTTRGILGDFDGDPVNDLATSAGQVLPDPPSREQLYGRFADSWRVTAATSLLPYPPGTSTETFTDRTFPDKPITVADLDPARREAAQRLCRALGVVDPAALDDCVLDVVLSGQPAFATTAATADRHVPGAEPPTGGVVQPGGTLRDLTRASASITTAGQVHTYSLDLGAATVLRLADLAGETGHSGEDTLLVTLQGPDGSDEPGFTYTTNFQWKVKRGGTYTLRVSRDDGDTGPYGFLAVAAKERRSAMTVGERVTGGLDVRGRVDLHTFEAAAPGRIHVEACTGSGLDIAVVEDSPAPRVFTPHDVCTDVELARLEAGKRYVLVVWSENERTGSYTFTPVVSAAD